MEQIETSPLPEVEVEKVLTFPEAIEQATNGLNIRRLGWPEGEYGSFKVFSDGEFLCIFKDGKEHIWQVSKGDAVEVDYVAY